MKQTIFTLLLFSTIGLISCRKNGVQADIQQYDQTQIQSYISANGITGMHQDIDSAGVDTSGIYYKIITPGSGQRLADTNLVAFVFSIKSFDGKYVNVDTIENHYNGYVGHIPTDALPDGLRIAILNDLKYAGGSMRILIPSNLAYGVNGYGTGSVTNTSTHIAGNQCLDYYVHVIGGDLSLHSQQYYQEAYDQQVMANYIKSNSLTGYIKTQSTNIPGSSYYYKILQPGTTGGAGLNQNSTFETTYTGRLLDNVVFDGANNGADSVSLDVPNLIKGVQEAMTHATTGTLISMILPSALCYGPNTTTGVPVNSSLRFEFKVYSVTE
jgi:FKBP-type peptidyl-prolyl cis-trans isomerase FkpA